MLPARPCSSLTAASSARMAGGEPSYPTTRYRFPGSGAVASIATNAIRFPGAASRYPACGRHDSPAERPELPFIYPQAGYQRREGHWHGIPPGAEFAMVSLAVVLVVA